MPKKKKYFTVFALFYFAFCYLAVSKYKLPGNYIRGGGAIYKRVVFALRVWRAYILRGLYMKGIILGILPHFVNTLARVESV